MFAITITEAEVQSVLPMLISRGEAPVRRLRGLVYLPTIIESNEGNAVLLSEEHWNEICRKIGTPVDDDGVALHISLHSLQCGRSARGKSPLHRIIAETVKKDFPVMVEAAGSKGVLVSQKYWDGIEETRYLLSIPGMKESLLEGMKEDISECSEELKW
ncbi:MAG: hypothetical protein OXU41_08420 [Gammaproteobacteria bacterium]|nr:hypothetical protein [Gammaproteobacteria bacterium]MDD9871525.1 hypothetical protein [Gammaproteobacteria bacterium]